MVRKLTAGGHSVIQRCLLFMVIAGIFVTFLQLHHVDLEQQYHRLNRFLLLRLRYSRQNSTQNIFNSPEGKAIKAIHDRMPNLPIVYWITHKYMQVQLNESCAKLPSLFELEFNNMYYQTLLTSNGTFQLYGAYLDNRKFNRMGPTVRILCMLNRIQPKMETYCQLWFNKKRKPVIVRIVEYSYIWYKAWGSYKQGIYQPYLAACVLPKEYKYDVPQAVSLVENTCDTSTNLLKVIYDRPEEKKDFAVCVKGLDFPEDDISGRLVEWIELLQLLGADKIFFYEFQVHQNVSKVLKHYQAEGKIHVTPITLAGGQPNAPAFQHLYLSKKTNHKRLNELIPYNDCFYKHMYEYRYIALLDVDEVIMPLKVATWQDLLESVFRTDFRRDHTGTASYCVRNVYFMDDLRHDDFEFKDIPKYMHMMRQIYRSKTFSKSGMYQKCFHNTKKILTLHNHYARHCVSGGCPNAELRITDAQLNHYRTECVEARERSSSYYKKNSVLDAAIWRFKGPLISRVSTALETLQLFINSSNENDLTNTQNSTNTSTT